LTRDWLAPITITVAWVIAGTLVTGAVYVFMVFVLKYW
jgi:hypothetical protein